jgi:hypothetical protein
VLSKCANPACFARFRYLSQGRIFNIEMTKTSTTDFRAASQKIEHFWLCETCSRVMKVVRENGLVTTRPLYRQLTAGSAAEHPLRQWPAIEKPQGAAGDAALLPQGQQPASILFGHVSVQIPRK